MLKFAYTIPYTSERSNNIGRFIFTITQANKEPLRDGKILSSLQRSPFDLFVKGVYSEQILGPKLFNNAGFVSCFLAEFPKDGTFFFFFLLWSLEII